MKERLDVLVVQRGLAPSREKAKALIMSGAIFVDSEREDKCGSRFDVECDITLHGKTLPYVSRGGLKLARAIDTFHIDLDGKICMDVGASTGGFTDCMLQNGASLVYAIDVGYGQFDWGLRNDKRVVCMEKTNIRHMTPADIDDTIDFASCDVSFISLGKVMPAIRSVLGTDGELVALIKPQFEAGRDKVGKKGVVRDKSVHKQVIRDVVGYAKESDFEVRGLDYSPIKGPEGNIEYLIYLVLRGSEDEGGNISEADINDVVSTAHANLNHKES